jgi:hypothetical protein
MSIATQDRNVIEATAGSKVTIPLVLTKRMDFSGSTLQMKAFGDGMERLPPFNISLDAVNSEAVIDLASLQLGPGEYSFAFYTGAVAKYRIKPDAPSQDTVDIVITEPISIRVKPTELK